MFTGAETLLISGGVKVAETVMGMASSQNKIDAIVADTNAVIARRDASMRAMDIRKQGASTMGAARTSLAASGVDVSGGGSVDVIEQQITKDTERDAYMALLTGDRVANQYTENGYASRRAQKDQNTAGLLDLTSTVLGTSYGVSKWLGDNRGLGITGKPLRTQPTP